MIQSLFDSVEDHFQVNTESFEALEAKIIEVLGRLKSLQAEKSELQKQVDALQARVQDAARQVEELTHERDALRSNQRDVEQEELIRSKITALLNKLEAA
jgi:FtsZ-binding cell division protein ZapB